MQESDLLVIIIYHIKKKYIYIYIGDYNYTLEVGCMAYFWGR